MYRLFQVSELLTPTGLVDLMNEYLAEMTNILQEERGTSGQIYWRCHRRHVRGSHSDGRSCLPIGTNCHSCAAKANRIAGKVGSRGGKSGANAMGWSPKCRLV